MPRSPKIREPSMPPSMARAKDDKLRPGWTTGSCAAAAAKAAARTLLTGTPQSMVEVTLPKKGVPPWSSRSSGVRSVRTGLRR